MESDHSRLKAILASANFQGANSLNEDAFRQVLRYAFNLQLGELIEELWGRHQYSSHVDFQRDISLHTRIVGYFAQMRIGNFWPQAIDNFQTLETRLNQGFQLESRRNIELGEKQKLAQLQEHLPRIRPLIDKQKALEYAEQMQRDSNLPARISTGDITSLGSMRDFQSERDVYQHYLTLIASISAQKLQLVEATHQRQQLEGSFTPLSSDEAAKLNLFKQDRDPMYCSTVYAVNYGNWILTQLRGGVLRIDIHHHFD